MSGSQIILLLLVAVVTAGGFAGASLEATYRKTPARILLSLVVPILWCLSICFPSWTTHLLNLPVFVILLLIPLIPAFVVYVTVAWIVWSMALMGKSAGKAE
jgi:hypothetical protein